MNKFVSFISPVYNVNKYLPDLLESFVHLPKSQYELIIVDDKGDERPDDIIEKYIDNVNIKFIKNKENLGLGFARNEGLKNISKKSTHFMFIDSDDILNKNAWDSIVNCDNDITLSKNFIIFSKTKNKTKKIWKNAFYKGSGVSPAWGHLISVKYKSLHFSSMFFEDQRYIAKLTFNNKYDWFDSPIINYRNRKSSILNENNNSKRKAEHILQFVEELSRSKDEALIRSNFSFKAALIFAKVEYFYISKKYRKNIKINEKHYTNFMNLCALILGLLEKASGFWWFFNKFGKEDYYE